MYIHIMYIPIMYTYYVYLLCLYINKIQTAAAKPLLADKDSTLTWVVEEGILGMVTGDFASCSDLPFVSRLDVW